jgi:exonuclease III
MSLNVRGIQTLKKRKDYFIWLDKFKDNIILLQDTHSCILDENYYKNHWGHAIFFSHGLTNSRGVITIIPKYLGGTSKLFYSDLDGRILIVELNINGVLYYILNIYAPSSNIEKDKLNFINKLKSELLPLINNNIIIGGDWNIVLDPNIDKKGGSNIAKYPKYRENLLGFLELFDLSDCWRLHHPNKRQYTWRQTKPTIFCRLDMIFISSNLLNITKKCSIDLGHKTDHSSVKVTFQLSNFKRGKGIWKFNNSLLHDKNYINLIKTTIKDELEVFNNMENKGFGWDYVKMRIRSDTMMFSGTKNKLQKIEIDRLEIRLKILDQLYINNPTENYELEMNTIKTELEEINNEKLISSIFRSKCNWAEEGEKSSNFFLNLEKHNYENKNITKLTVDNNEVNEEKLINKAIKDFYENLYSDNECNLQLLDDIIIDLPQLNDKDKTLTNGTITEAEALKSLKALANGKTPGIDGLTTDFYKKIWTDIKHYVLKSINYAFEIGEMSKDQKLGIITLSPKKNKIRLLLKNWRPITLLTVDYKLIAKSLANRLETILPHYVSMNQFGYVKGRYIGENVRCVIDINELCNQQNISALAIQIDFEKAFDSISWKFMFRTLEKMNFGTDFISWVKVLYKNTSSVVINNGNLTDPFNLYRGVHQGCPLSALLFILLVQVLQHMLNKREDISGLNINGKTIKLLQMADDTTIFTSNHEDAGRIIRLLKAFF